MIEIIKYGFFLDIYWWKIKCDLGDVIFNFYFKSCVFFVSYSNLFFLILKIKMKD